MSNTDPIVTALAQYISRHAPLAVTVDTIAQDLGARRDAVEHALQTIDARSESVSVQSRAEVYHIRLLSDDCCPVEELH
jgi:hypothetical protein